MAGEPGGDARTRLLRRLRGRRFDRIRYRAQDAVAIRAFGSRPNPRSFRAAVRDLAQVRWYPVRGDTYLVKWPYLGGALPKGARVERGGWDHENCSACHRRIEAGRTFWQTARGDCIWLCPYGARD
ncbi:MAG TPA: hypothetical protein VFY93_08010 [Planctomycetota bacterium]|nr:hypothetical protein [Planctomycetota bacterium]